MPVKSHKEFWITSKTESLSTSVAENQLWNGIHELEDEVRRLGEANESKSRILDVLGRATGQESVDAMCRSIVEGVRDLLCIDRAGLLLWDESTQRFRGTFGTALDGQTMAEHHLVIEPRSGDGWTRILQGEHIARGCKLGQPDEREGEEAIKADLVALRMAGRLYGVISVDNRISRGAISVEVLEHLSLLGQILGNVVELSRFKGERESEFRQAQTLDAIGRLAGGVAHDFNNLLTTILGCCTLLQERPGLDAEAHEDLLGIQASAERAAKLTQQLLAFSRRQILQLQRLNINQVLQNMEAELRQTLGNTIELVIKLDPGLCPIGSDAEQLRQVVLQLAVNAREAMSESSPYYQPDLWSAKHSARSGAPRPRRLSLETANVRLDTAYAVRHPGVSPGAYALLSISDTGVGMPRHILEHIFEPFFTTKEVGHGEGLGLSTVYGIIKQMGGDIQVSSHLGEGSTFRIYLPRLEAAPPVRVKTQPAEEKTRGSESILVVEDEADVRELMVRMIESFGYRARPAANGREALKLAEQAGKRIDLIITDMIMPVMNGKELVEQLRKRGHAHRVLVVSGYNREDFGNGQPAGSEIAFLQKPFSRDALMRKIREVLDSPAPARR